MIQILVTLPFVLVGATSRLQEVYYYMYKQAIYSEGLNVLEDVGFYPVVDGFFKEISADMIVQTNIAGGAQPMIGVQILNQTERLEERGTLPNATLDWINSGSFGGDDAVAYTTGAEIATHWVPIPSNDEHHMWWRERISRVCMANHKYSMNMAIIDMLDATLTAGTVDVYIELMQVVNPVEFNFIYARPTGLKFFMVVGVLEETAVSLSVEFPTNGYLTNISVIVTAGSVNDAPSFLTWTTDDIDIKDHWAFTQATWFSRGRDDNGFSVMIGREEGLTGGAYTWFFNHFGNKRVYIKNLSMLNFYLVSNSATSFGCMVQADFIPQMGASWRQIFVENTFAGGDYANGWEFPIDLDNAVVTIIANIITGVGTMFVKLVHPEHLVNASFAETSESDIVDTIDYIDQGMTSAQNLQAVIPLSSTRGAQQPQISLGKIHAGTHFTWDWIIGTTISNAELYFVITGKVGRKYYSRGAKFLHSTIMKNNIIAKGFGS